MRLLLPAALGLLLLPVLGPAVQAARGGSAPAHSARPPTESTGGFGEDTCAFCHLDGELNEEGGTLELLGLPEEGYVAGRPYELTVRLHRPGIARAGFQIAARFGSGPSEGEQAGAFIAGEGQVVQEPSYLPVQYLGHDAEGVEPAEPGVGRWTFEWIAPPDAGPVLFHAAGNAADGDGAEWGDRIYTLEATLEPAGS